MNKTFALLTLFSFLSQATFAGGRIQNEDVKSVSDITAAVLTTTGNLSASSACITSPGSTTGLTTGLYVYDTTTPANVASGTTVVGLPGTCSAGQIQMSANGGGTATGDTLTFGGQASQTINDSKIFVTANGINTQLSTAITNGLVGGAGGSSYNMLTGAYNPGFETGSTSNWTASGGTFTVTNSSPLFGNYSGHWTASASSQTLYSTLLAIPTGLQGGNCMGAIGYQYPSGSAGDYSLVVSNGTTVLASQTLPVASTATSASVSFVCPSSGSLEVGLKSNVASPSAITLDGPGFNAGQVLLGSNALLSQVSQAQLLGQVKITGCASPWSTSSTSLTAFSTQSGCTYAVTVGSATAPSTNIPGITFASLAPGNYVLTYQGQMGEVYGSVNSGSAWQFWDGTNTANEISGGPTAYSGNPFAGMPGIQNTISYSTPQTNVTLSIRGVSGSSSSTAEIWGQTATPGVISVYYYPSQSQLAQTTQVTPANWSGNSSLTGTTTSTSYADPGSISGVITTAASQNISCVAATSLLGVTCTLPSTGVYQVCYTGTAQNSGTNGTVVQLTDGSNTTIVGQQNLTSTSANAGVGMGGCGNYSAASTTATFKVRAFVGGATGTLSPTTFSVTSLNTPVAAPLLVGSVTSTTAGQEHIERLAFGGSATVDGTNCTSSPCTIGSQSGSWITSVTRGSTGSYTVNFTAGEFSAAPICSCGGASAGVSNIACSAFNATTSAVQVSTDATSATSGTQLDAYVHVFCMGPH